MWNTVDGSHLNGMAIQRRLQSLNIDDNFKAVFLHRN